MRKQLLNFCVIAGLLLASGCSENQAPKSSPPPPPRKQLNMRGSFDEGWLLSHDLTLNNTSGEDLTEVKLTISFIGENASPSVSRYWARWSLGEQQYITIPVADVKNIQRVEISGTTDQGDIDLAWKK